MYGAHLSQSALKDISKLDKHQAKIITAWVRKNLDKCHNPKRFGKALQHELKEYWRYRVGDYRLIADIQDDIISIEILRIGHRKNAQQFCLKTLSSNTKKNCQIKEVCLLDGSDVK